MLKQFVEGKGAKSLIMQQTYFHAGGGLLGYGIKFPTATQV